MKTFPTLNKLTSSGNLQTWTISVIEPSDIVVEFGQKGGKIQRSVEHIAEGKNIGKANETTPYEQACLEAESRWRKKLDSGYFAEGKQVATPSTLPMLAQSYDKHSKKIKWPVYSQPKYDGCLTGDSLLQTKEHGLQSIKFVVDNQLKCKVKSYNTKRDTIEYKPIISYFKNRELDEDIQWYELELSDGKRLRATGNHKVYLPDFDCWRRVDQLTGNENLMVN